MPLFPRGVLPILLGEAEEDVLLTSTVFGVDVLVAPAIFDVDFPLALAAAAAVSAALCVSLILITFGAILSSALCAAAARC